MQGPMQLKELLQFQENAENTADAKKNLGKPAPGSVSADQEKTLATFMKWLLPKWEDFAKLFTNGGTLEFEGFENAVRWQWRYPGDAKHVFGYLDPEGKGHIVLRKCLDLKRSYEKNQKVEAKGLAGLKKLMAGKHGGSLARVWRTVFDKEDTGKCSERVFVKCCKENGFTGDVKSTWAEITNGEMRAVTMKDWDPEADTLFTALCQYLQQRHGALREGWGAMLKHGYGKSGRINLQEWTDICRGLGFSAKDAKVMFMCLDKDLSRTLDEEEFLFIRKWEKKAEVKKERKGLMSPTGTQGVKSPSSTMNKGATAGATVGSPSARGTNAWSDTPELGSLDSPTDAAKGLRGLAGGGGGAFEFVVVLNRSEYNEYLKRRRDSDLNGPSSKPDSPSSITEGKGADWSSSPGSPGFGGTISN